MKPRTELSNELYRMMVRIGYPKDFADIITQNLNTDWTARRMMGYLRENGHLSLEEVADEMLAILSDRNRIMQKKDAEEVNARWNMFLETGFDDEGED